MNDFTKENFLAHHGILGQKWGIRRFQPYPKGYHGDGKFTGTRSKKKLSEKQKHVAVMKLVDELNTKWEYGVLNKGKRVTDTSQMNWSDYRTLPVERLAKEKIGVCWDFVNYQHHVLDKLGIPNKNYMVVCRRSKDPDDILTHTFTIATIGGKNKWIESARWKDRGVHDVSSYKDVIGKLRKDDFGDKPYDVYEFNPDGMDKGLTGTEYFDKATQNLVETSQKNYMKIT